MSDKSNVIHRNVAAIGWPDVQTVFRLTPFAATSKREISYCTSLLVEFVFNP